MSNFEFLWLSSSIFWGFCAFLCWVLFSSVLKRKEKIDRRERYFPPWKMNSDSSGTKSFTCPTKFRWIPFLFLCNRQAQARAFIASFAESAGILQLLPKMCSPTKRRDMDVMKLMMTDYKVETIDNSMSEFFVEFNGPANSPYHGGIWKVRVEIPDAYPYRSPSIGFVNKIYHPNIDERSGSVCLDVINQTWSPMFDLVNIFEVFLPQLLIYPNPSDPLNGEAAALMMRDRNVYEQKVKEYCERYAKASDIKSQHSETTDDDDDDDDDDDEKYATSEDEMDVEGAD